MRARSASDVELLAYFGLFMSKSTRKVRLPAQDCSEVEILQGYPTAANEIEPVLPKVCLFDAP
jgi:hypothetical protein